jgi:transcriptional regulator with XRE-family HTH domain
MHKDRKYLDLFGRRLRHARQARSLTQEQLADSSGFDRTYISLLERGRRNLSLLNLVALAKALRIHPSELLQDTSRREQ